jgi:hypothetical protein
MPLEVFNLVLGGLVAGIAAARRVASPERTAEASPQTRKLAERDRDRCAGLVVWCQQDGGTYDLQLACRLEARFLLFYAYDRVVALEFFEKLERERMKRSETLSLCDPRVSLVGRAVRPPIKSAHRGLGS